MAASALWNPFPGTGEHGCFTAHKAHIHLRESSGLCSTLPGAYIQQVSHLRMKSHTLSNITTAQRNYLKMVKTKQYTIFWILQTHRTLTVHKSTIR